MALHEAMIGRRPIELPEALPVEVIDSHTHLEAIGFDSPPAVGRAMDRAASVGVAQVVTIADSLDDGIWAGQATEWHPNLFAAVGLHPTRADTLDDAAKQILTELAALPKVVAIGETGLDHYWDAAPHQVQADAFAWHIELAKSCGKALVIHDRDAHDAVLDVLAAEGAPERVIFHCFSGDVELARKVVARDWYASFAGPVSYRNATALREAARVIPTELLLAETDAPFLAPHPQRGRINEPAALPYTVRALADCRGQDLTQVCRAVTDNARRVFGLPKPA